MPISNSDIQSFPKLPTDFQDAAALTQRQFKEGFESLNARTEELETEQRKRRIVAIILKIISAFCGLMVLSGMVEDIHVQILGGLITGIAALERIFANMSRLLAVSAAVAAYERLKIQVIAKHNREIIQVVKIRERDPDISANRLIRFVGSLKDKIALMESKVEGDLRNNAYENLGRLVLDEGSPRE